MKINITINGNNQQKQIIDLDEYNDIVWSIKSKLDKIFNEKGKFTKKYLNVFYKGLILDDYKSIIFYKIIENDEICIGQLETFLGSELIVVEMFLIGSISELIYLTVRRTDLLSEFESILRRLFPNLNGLQIWSRKGIQLQRNQHMIDIDQNEEYFKILVEISEDENAQMKSFEECCNIHNQNILSRYGWFDKFKEEPSRRFLISPVKQIIPDIESCHDKYHEDLSSVLISLRHSKYLFCMNFGNQILDICAEIFDPLMIRYGIKDVEKYDEFVIFFRIAIHLALINYINNSQINSQDVHKSIKDILLNAVHHLLSILEDSFVGWRDLMKSFINHFLLFPIKNTDMTVSQDETFNEYSYINLNESTYRILFPKQLQTNFQANSMISLQTGIPINKLYFTELGNNEPPDGKDVFDLKKVNRSYYFDIIYEMDSVKILEKLDEGSFGQVFRCLDENNRKEFVLKEQLSQLSLYRDIMIQISMRRDGKILKYDRLFNNNGQICIAIKYMEKGSLRSILNQEKYLSENEAIRITYQLLLQIIDLHKVHNIIHRDIKSDNIVLDINRNAKLIDFGVSKYIHPDDIDKSLKNVNGYTPGTIFYMAPELLNDEPYTNLIDIWSFGIVVIEMITGYPPYYRLGEGQVILIIPEKKKIRYKSPQAISKQFSEFIEACLEPDCKKRLQAEQLIKFPIFKSFSDLMNIQ